MLFVYIKRREERMFRVGVRKAETQMELNLVRDVKNNMKEFHRYVCQKKQAKENIFSLVNEKREQV